MLTPSSTMQTQRQQNVWQIWYSANGSSVHKKSWWQKVCAKLSSTRFEKSSAAESVYKLTWRRKVRVSGGRDLGRIQLFLCFIVLLLLWFFVSTFPLFLFVLCPLFSFFVCLSQRWFVLGSTKLNSTFPLLYLFFVFPSFFLFSLFVRLSEAPKGGSPIQLFLCLFVLSFYLFVQRPSQQWVGLGSTEPYPAFPLFCFSSFVCVFVQCPSQQWVGLGSTELDSTFPLFYFPELLTDFNGTSYFCKTPFQRKIKQKQETEAEWINV